MTINFGGNVYDDAGNAVSGASVKLLETGTTTQEGSTVTTDSDGRWDFSEADQDRYDVEITKGSSVRRIKWSDEISLQEIDVRNNTGATTPAATFSNITNSTANQVAVFSGANSTKADNDEIYLSFKMHDSAGNLDEFARMTVVATDVTSGSEDSKIEFDVLKGGSPITAFTIASSTAGAQSIDFNQDSITFGTGTAATDITLTFDAESADGVITWMEDEDYFKFSDEILMNGTEKILFGDTATFIHQSSDGVMTVDGEATIDLNASTAVLVSNDLKLNSDSAVLGFGADNDTTLTHTDGTGLTLNSTNKLTFGDTGTFIHQSSDGVLTITSDTTVDINGAVAFDGAITGATNITLSGELDAATLDISGNADIDGTLEADAITVDGTTLAEYISDTAGAMFSSNTETGIAVTYQDGDNTIDLALSAAQTTITSLFATDIKIGEDDQTKIDFEDANTINFYANNAKEVVLAENSISPGTSDGTALGTTSLMWSDLFLASGSVINFNNGDITLTHSSNTLTAAGGTIATAALTTSTIVASGIIKTDDTTAATSTTDGSLQTDGGLSVVLDAVVGDDVILLSDSARIHFGADSDVVLQHSDDVGLTLNSTNKLMFNDSSQFIQGSSNTVLSIGATDEIDLTATAVDLNGTLNVSGTVTVGSDGSGTDVIFYSGTSGDNLTWDASEEVLQITGTNGATSLDVLDGDVRIVDKLYFYDRGGEYISSDGSLLLVTAVSRFTGNVSMGTGQATPFGPLQIGSVGDNDAELPAIIIPANDGLQYQVGIGSTNVSGQGQRLDFFAGESSGTTASVTASALKMSLNVNGLLFINEQLNGKMTTGLTINQGAADDEVLAFKSSDVGHGMTDRAENDTFGEMKKVSAGNGGLQVNGYSESTTALRIHGMGKTDNTTKSTSGAAYVAINASKADGVGLTSVGADANLLVVQMQGLTKFLVDEDGDIHAVNATVSAFDSYDDALLVRAVSQHQSPKDIVSSKWDDFVQYSEQSLIDAGILGDTIKNGGLFNITGLQRLHNGAIWQAYVERRQFEERMNTLESKLLMLEGGK